VVGFEGVEEAVAAATEMYVASSFGVESSIGSVIEGNADFQC
jgi:hypothetical protein